MASEWFDSVTGSNDYERQSYRDSYNGGKAAGDWTGNVNKNLDAERAAFQGSTWSGSSTQPSALQTASIAAASPPAAQASAAAEGHWASSGNRGLKVWVPAVGPSAAVAGSATQGPAAGTVREAGAVVTSGPGSAGWSAAPNATGVGPSSTVAQSNLPPLVSKLTPNNTIVMINGSPFRPNPGTSDVSELENMMGEGESPLDIAWWKKQEMAWSHVNYNMPLIDLSWVFGKPDEPPRATSSQEWDQMMRQTR